MKILIYPLKLKTESLPPVISSGMFFTAPLLCSPEIFDFINPTSHSPTNSSKSLNATPNLASTGNLLQKASSGVWRQCLVSRLSWNLTSLYQ